MCVIFCQTVALKESEECEVKQAVSKICLLRDQTIVEPTKDEVEKTFLRPEFLYFISYETDTPKLLRWLIDCDSYDK